MEVQINSEEIIKPSSSTPPHLRTYNLSLLDQIAPPQYIPVVLFYSPPAISDSSKISHLLKQSLSLTLTHFYPLAGRLRDPVSSIDCNDNGVSLTEANVSGSMSELFQELDIHHHVQKLLPCDPYGMLPDISTQEFLKAQVNYFECGGIAISVCLWHLIGDGYTAASFVKCWAGIAYGSHDFSDIGDVVVDRASLFPPQDIKSLLWCNLNPEELRSNISMKRLVFDGSKLSGLREEVGKGPYLDHPTRVEAVISLIWKAVRAATGKEYVAAIAVDLRKRIDPPFPKNCIGNIVHVTFSVHHSSEDHYNLFAGKLHESIKMINNEYVRKSHAGGEYFKHVKDIVADGKMDNPDLFRILPISSWCRFPFYEADFGWGKPTWVIPALVNPGVFLLDTKDGLGIDAWIGLPKESMPMFEQNPDICAYTSFTTPKNFQTK